YIIFRESAAFYWTRSRILETLNSQPRRLAPRCRLRRGPAALRARPHLPASAVGRRRPRSGNAGDRPAKVAEDCRLAPELGRGASVRERPFRHSDVLQRVSLFSRTRGDRACEQLRVVAA